jgi:hypothetical protein
MIALSAVDIAVQSVVLWLYAGLVFPVWRVVLWIRRGRPSSLGRGAAAAATFVGGSRPGARSAGHDRRRAASWLRARRGHDQPAAYGSSSLRTRSRR